MTKNIEDTKELIRRLPISTESLIEIILASWDSLLKSKIGEEGFDLISDFNLSPQIIGTFLEKIVARKLESEYPDIWRGGIGDEKDIVCKHDNSLSIEMKTSTSRDSIYGNRSYAQPSTDASKKDKSGYYIAINYTAPKNGDPGKIRRIAVGWLSHSDWRGQKSETGQQASLTDDAKKYSMVPIYVEHLPGKKLTGLFGSSITQDG